MRPALLDIKAEGDLGGKKIAMTLDTESLAHIMSVLTDLYSDQAMAVIREYSTNAYDAHVLAKNPAPIEVTSPNNLSPFFKVKDYGIGMSVDDIVNIYSRYGASQKRDSDEQNGRFGLGCKSALTFTSQFTVVAVKDGVKIFVSISRTPDGSGQMEIVDESLVDEPNSVEVIVPVGAYHEGSFNEKIKEFFSYWKPGTVLVDEQAPAFVGDIEDVIQLDNNLILIPDQYGKDVIVMGNVAYPANDMNIFKDAYKKPYRAIAWVEIGDVNIPPNREALIYTEQTKAAVKKVYDTIAATVVEKIEDDIADSAHYCEAVRQLLLKWRSVVGKIDVHYNGMLLKERPQLPLGTWHYEIDGTGRCTNHVGDIYYSTPGFVITNFPKTSGPTAHDRTKVRLYLKDIGKYYTDILFFQDGQDPRFAHLPSVEWEVVKAIKVDKSGQPLTSFSVLNKRGNLDTLEDISDKPVLYYLPGSSKPKVSSIAFLTVDYNIVKLMKSVEGKFKAQFPKAELLDTFLKDKFAIAKASLSEYDRIKHFSDYYYNDSRFVRIPPDKIEDQDLAEYLRKTQGSKSPEMVEYEKWASACSAMGIGISRVDRATNRFYKKYPLADSGHIEHSIIYINAIYEMEKNGNQV